MAFMMGAFIAAIRFASLSSDVNHAVVAAVVPIATSSYLGDRVPGTDFSSTKQLIFVAASAAAIVAGNLTDTSFVIVIFLSIIAPLGLPACDLTVVVDLGALDELELGLLLLWGRHDDRGPGGFLNDDLLRLLADDNGLRWIRAGEIFDRLGVSFDIVGITARSLDFPFISVVPLVRATVGLTLPLVSLYADISVDAWRRWRSISLEAFDADLSPFGLGLRSALSSNDASLFEITLGTTVSVTIVDGESLVVFFAVWYHVALDGGEASSVRGATDRGSVIPVPVAISISISLSLSLSNDDRHGR